MLSLDWSIVWIIVNLLVLYVLLKRFLFKPVCEMMDKRAKLIQDSLDEAEEKKSEAERLREDYKAALENARREAAEITEAAKAGAAGECEIMLENARAESARLISDAERSIENERARAMNGAKYEIADLALLAAAKVLSQKADSIDGRELAESFISEAGEPE